MWVDLENCERSSGFVDGTMSSSFYLIFPIQNRDTASYTWSHTGMEYFGYSGKITECTDFLT